MTRSACGMVGVLLAETSPSSRAARLRSSSLDLDFPGAAAELRLSNIAVGNTSIWRSVSIASSRSWAASRPSRARRPGTEASALGLGWTQLSTTCSQVGTLLTPAKLESYLYSIYDTSTAVSRAPLSTHTHTMRTASHALGTQVHARGGLSQRGGAALEATAPRTSQARSSVSGACGWPPHSSAARSINEW